MKETRRDARRAKPRAVAWWAGLLAMAALGACSVTKPTVVDFQAVGHDYRSEDYPRVYEKWTRHEKVTKDIDQVLEVWATYKSRDYREAFVAHYAEAYSLHDEDRERLRRHEREEAGTWYEFLVTAQSANYRWNDLEKKNSPWRVTLVDGLGKEMAPEQFKVEKLPDMFEQEFFPAKTPFTKTYVARFPRAGGNKEAGGGKEVRDEDFAGERTGLITLRFAGPMGRADLTWTSR